MLDEIMLDVTEIIKVVLADILKENGIGIKEGTCATAIEKDGVHVLSNQGEKGLVEADNVIFAAGSLPQDALSEKVEEEFQVFRIGDCAEPRDIFHAVREGSFIARQI
jgi:NADH dehydrogenase FAD-containing subunit